MTRRVDGLSRWVNFDTDPDPDVLLTESVTDTAWEADDLCDYGEAAQREDRRIFREQA